MANAKISRACANFLSDVDLKPGLAQSGGGINDAGTQQVRFVGSSYDVWSECNVQVETRGLFRDRSRTSGMIRMRCLIWNIAGAAIANT